MKYLTSDQFLKNRRFFNPFSKSRKTAEKNNNGIIIQLVQEFKDLNKKDIQDWRKSLELAENPEEPRRGKIQSLYDYLMPDGHLQALIQIRKMATLSTKTMILDKKTGKEQPDKTELLKTSWFYNLLNLSLGAIFRGFQLIELTDPNKMKFDLVPPYNVVPQKDLVLFEMYGDEGIYYNTPEWEKYLIRVGPPNDLGILNDIVPQLIWKKNAQQAWAEFSEKFGIPLTYATTTKSGDGNLKQIRQQLENLGAAAGAILPDGTTIDIKEGANAGNINVFEKQIERTNSEMSKRILGGTMVSDNGSSRSQSEVHERTLNDKIAAADKLNIEFLVNNQVLPLLATWGMPFSENDKFTFDRSKTVGMEKHWNIVKDALDKYDIPDEWVSKTFNFPITGRKKQESKPGGATANFNQPLPVGWAGASKGVDFPAYQECCNHTMTAAINKSFEELEKQSEAILKELWKKGKTDKHTLSKSLIAGTWLQEGLFSGWGKRRMQVEYNATDHVALAFMEYNLFHFSHARELAGLQELNQLLFDKEKLEIRSFADFKRQAEPLLKQLNKNWLRTERNFAVATAQNASAFQLHWSEKDTVTKYIQYQTAGDSNVRSEHRVLHGLIFDINDPDARRLYAPNGHGCRCEFIQYLGNPKKVTKGIEAIESLELDKETAQKMLRNRGELKEVFAANQFYIESKERDYANSISKIDYAKYGLKKYADMKGLKTLTLDSSINESNINELFKPEKNASHMGFSDYIERKMLLDKKDFKKNTSGGKIKPGENRHKLFPHVEGVIKNPDEVYMASQKSGQIEYRYIKFYDEKYLVVDVVVKDSAEIKEWFYTSDNSYRKGLLINKH